MEHKKNPKLDTARLSNLFFSGGLLVALSLTIFAFEYKTYDEIADNDCTQTIETVGIDIITQDEPEIIPHKELPAPLVKEDPIFKPAKEEKPDSAKVIDDKDKNTNPLTTSDTTKRGGKAVVLPFEKPVVVPDNDGIIEVAQKSAEFVGGIKEYLKFLGNNLKYPNSALRNGIEGTVYIKFIVDKDGSIMKDCVKVSKSIDPVLDAEAIRVVKMSPNWTPALQNERPIRQRLRVPVKFKINK